MEFTLLGIFIGSLLSTLLYKRYSKAVFGVLVAVLLAVIGYFGQWLPQIMQGEKVVTTIHWIPSLDIHFSFLLDGLSLFFALLISVFGLLILLYSRQYMVHHPQRDRFIGYLLFFMGAMLGLVLSANLISLFIFWELTSFSSFLLIGFKHHKQESIAAARQSLIVTAGGGLALLAGFILLALISDSGYDLIGLLAEPDVIAQSPFLHPTIILIALGAFTKSAQFPFHFWLPNAMAAPTPVSAFLHSATMVKAGVYLVFRLSPLFEGVMLWHYLLGIAGAVTMTWGAYKAFRQDDIKRILAYTTISALGIFFLMTGVGGKEAINAVIIYVLAHALYKGALFLAAGNIDHQTGTRNISDLSDLVRKMPYTATAVILATASMAGLLPFLGFVGKESLYHALYYDSGEVGWLYLALLFLAGAFFMAVTIEILFHAFFNKGTLRNTSIKEAPALMVLAPLILAGLGLFTGLAPGLTLEPLLQWSAASIHQSDPTMELKLWHGFNFVLLLSLLTLLAGVGLYFVRGVIQRETQPYWLKADYLYNKTIAGIESLATFSTNTLQNGLLRNYIAIVLLTFSVLLLFPLWEGRLNYAFSVEGLFQDLQVYEMVILIFVTFAVIFLFNTRSRLVVTATFGIVGYSIALGYTVFSAPDVAITQFLAETLTLILLILILHKLPSYTLKKPIARIKYLSVSLVFGALMATTSFLMLNQAKDSDLKQYFLENSVSKGKGQNAVNVILVDFRALDTLGEITVLMITMIGIIGLLTIKPFQTKR